MKKIKIYFGSNAQELKKKDFAYTIYLSIKATQDNTNVKFSKTGLNYSIDNGVTWTSLTNSGVTINKDECVLFRGKLRNSGTNGIGTFQVDKPYKLYGNPTSLINGSDDFLDNPNTELTSNYVFANLFAGTPVVNAHYLLLNSEELTEGCYQSMFNGCTQLETAPKILPAKTLKLHCYQNMFQGCTALTTAPELMATTLENYCYQSMFYQCSSLTTAPELPVTTLKTNCYAYMFCGCTSLTTAPKLPATKLANNCYEYMFGSCSSLTTVPKLPATTLANYCYSNMFRGCSSLITVPKLPATTLANHCYEYMFYNCSSLTTAPKLPATTLAQSCYENMFSLCSSLTTAPKLPATTLAERCYSYMFNGCTSLTTAPELPATTLAELCYYNMFNGCTSLTTAPELPANALISGCYGGMFGECENLNYIKAMFTTTPDITYTCSWVYNVSSEGTFVRNENATWNVRGINGIPEGWDVEPPFAHDYSTDYFTLVALQNTTINVNVPGGLSYSLDGGTTWSEESGSFTVNVPSNGKLLLKGNGEFNGTTPPSTPYIQSTGNYSVEGNMMSLSYADDFADKKTIQTDYEYAHFFENDTKLISAENFVLPATTLTTGCYLAMFNGCTSLTTAPELPATTLAEYCYQEMFGGCTSLTTAPELPATTLADYCYKQMFFGCTSLTTAPELPAMVLTASCYESMFSGSGIIASPRLNALDFYTCPTYCYRNMFAYCEHLNNIYAMFVDNPNVAFADPGAEEPDFSYTYNWIYGISETGKFYKNTNAYWGVDTPYIKGPSGIPENSGTCSTALWQLIDIDPYITPEPPTSTPTP